MKQSKKVISLKNIGKKLAVRLNEVGIFSEHDLKKVGPVKAYKLIKEQYPAEVLSVCYYLYSFEGALSGKHWNEIGEKRKRELKEKI